MVRWNEYFSSFSDDMLQTAQGSQAMSRVNCKSKKPALDIVGENAIFAEQMMKGFDNNYHLPNKTFNIL
jgi:hypothetical protein